MRFGRPSPRPDPHGSSRQGPPAEPITSGTIEGNKVTILAKHERNGREYRLELTVEDDQMKGNLTSGDRQASLLVKKRKE